VRSLGGEYEDLEEWVLKVRLAASWDEKEALLEDERWMLTVLEASELVSGYLDVFRGELNRRASSIAAEIRGSGRRYCVYPTPIRPLQRMVFEGERAEIRRGVAKRVDSGAEVVEVSGEGQLGGAGADSALGLDDGDRAAVAGELDGGCEAVGAGTDHHSVVGRASGHVIEFLDHPLGNRSAATNALRRAILLRPGSLRTYGRARPALSRNRSTAAVSE
jgi:hypothetical protein